MVSVVSVPDLVNLAIDARKFLVRKVVDVGVDRAVSSVGHAVDSDMAQLILPAIERLELAVKFLIESPARVAIVAFYDGLVNMNAGEAKEYEQLDFEPLRCSDKTQDFSLDSEAVQDLRTAREKAREALVNPKLDVLLAVYCFEVYAASTLILVRDQQKAMKQIIPQLRMLQARQALKNAFIDTYYGVSGTSRSLLIAWKLHRIHVNLRDNCDFEANETIECVSMLGREIVNPVSASVVLCKRTAASVANSIACGVVGVPFGVFATALSPLTAVCVTAIHILESDDKIPARYMAAGTYWWCPFLSLHGLQDGSDKKRALGGFVEIQTQ